MAKVAFSYARYSDLKSGEGTSEERQNDLAESWAARHGFVLKPLKMDKAKSAFHANHIKGGHFGRFLQELQLKNSPYRPKTDSDEHVLIVEKFDRLSRQAPLDSLAVIQQIINSGVDIVISATDKRYSRKSLIANPTELLEIQMLLQIAYGESKFKSDRLKFSWASKRKAAQSGKKVTSKRPAWINADGTVDEQKKRVMVRIFELSKNGKGPSSISKILNAEAFPTLRKAKAWTSGNIKFYLRNRTVLGEMQFHRTEDKVATPIGEPIQGYYPQIISQELWDDSNRAKLGRKRAGVKGRVSEAPNLFTRLLRNSFDGSTYFLKQSAKKGKLADGTETVWHSKRLAPSKWVDGRTTMPLSIDYAPFERDFITFVRELDLQSVFADDQKPELRKELDSLEAKLTDLEGTLQEAKKAFKASKGKSDTFREIIEETEAEQRKVAERAEMLRALLVSSDRILFEEVKDLLDDVDSRARIAAHLRLLIDVIEVFPIPAKPGDRGVGRYLLFVDVKFHNGQSRQFITDHNSGQREKADELPLSSLAFALALQYLPLNVQVDPKYGGFNTASGTTFSFEGREKYDLLIQLVNLYADKKWTERLLDYLTPIRDSLPPSVHTYEQEDSKSNYVVGKIIVSDKKFNPDDF